MRVLVDLRCAHAGLTGIGRYAVNLCLSLERASSKISVEAITGEAGAEYLRGSVSCPLHQIHSQGPAWDDLYLPDLISKFEADVYHSPLFILPKIRVTRYVATIHDVIPLVRPELTSPSFQHFFQSQIPAALRSATHIVTVSEYSRQDCIRQLRIDPSRITAIHEPVHPMFGRKPPLDSQAAIRTQGLRPGFLLSVGAIDRRKNLSRLVEAYALFRKRAAEPPPLVIAGAPNDDGFSLTGDIASAGLEKHVRILGRVSDEMLVHLYSTAVALVFPSLYEGFGLPVVEAMASGTPVIASRVASIPEVAGDAAILVDPANAEEIAAAIGRLVGDADLRTEMRKKGLVRTGRFTLERQAEDLLELYGRVLKEAA
jgi:glycosyltransferase involved in cell wall biosynthesis